MIDLLTAAWRLYWIHFLLEAYGHYQQISNN
uniref:Uncharacterized protein n=1 Tax=Tetranychus urticae TaxID=32264 RepID=T1K1X1_TETUR